VKVLTDAGFEAVHWSNCGKGSAADVEIMAFAKTNDYVVLTHDLDFSAILAATGADRPSVVQVRADDISTDAVGEPVVRAVELGEGALLTVEPSRARIKVLPLIPRQS
jgi:predicted nuclease of predicted toxin-antitoxin system